MAVGGVGGPGIGATDGEDIEESPYGQKMPIDVMGDMMGGGLDAPLMPIHF